MDPIGYWMGKPISDMTREELLELVKELGKMEQTRMATEANNEAMLDMIDRMRPPRKRFLGIL